MITLRRCGLAAALGTLPLALAGCFNPFAPLVAPAAGIYVPPPAPSTPQGVVRLFAWCWNNRAASEYREIFTDDFRFQFALGDSAGNQFRDRPLDRAAELEIAQHLFVGGGSEPPATSIRLTIDPTLNPTPDTRSGKDPGWHKEILTNVDLSIKTEDNEYRITGRARFFVTRGDSALIPQELKDRGFGPDPNRWYIDAWWDETETGPGGAAARRAGMAAGPRPAGAFVVTALERRPRDGAARAERAARALLPEQISWGQLNAFYAAAAR
ncbi:MAG: hypothetical protein HZC42_07310 [Candidatus Eisenbacteria bacterium]|nr:hypothetical protein [Candidatus Eisenbacteria bacterium]